MNHISLLEKTMGLCKGVDKFFQTLARFGSSFKKIYSPSQKTNWDRFRKNQWEWGKNTCQASEWVFIFYSPNLNFTRIWWVSEWVSATWSEYVVLNVWKIIQSFTSFAWLVWKFLD
jgi:hypothetical protein